MKEQVYNQQIFAKRLKDLMYENDDTVYTLAEYLNLSASMISKYKNCNAHPKVAIIKLIAEKYNVNPVWLMGADVEKYLKDVEVSEKYFIETMKEFLVDAKIIKSAKSPVKKEDLEKGIDLLKKLTNIYKISKEV